jgi:hypothetical protein
MAPTAAPITVPMIKAFVRYLIFSLLLSREPRVCAATGQGMSKLE